MSAAIVIRRLSSADAGAFHALRLKGLRESSAAFTSSYEEERELAVSAVAERMAATPDLSAIFGAFSDGSLVGVVGMQRERARKLAHKAAIWGMYVDPRFRHRGLGRRLVEQALAHAAALPRLRQVNLGVNAANSAAIALYESVGFVSYGIERDFLLDAGTFHDEVLMVYVLERS